MIGYVLYHILGKKIDVTESKRIANKSFRSGYYKVWEFEGRKGGEYERRLKKIIDCIESEESIPQNLAKDYQAPQITRTRTEEHNAKIARAMSGKAKSESHCAAISEAMIGNSNFQR